MSPEHKEQLKRIKTLKVREDIPDDLRIAVQTFIEQAVIVGEYELDTMPVEYVNNLLEAFSKYPQYNHLMNELIKILKENQIIDY